MEANRYNGYANYETWATALWLSDDEASHVYWSEAAEAAREEAARCRQVRDEVWTAEKAPLYLLAGRIKEEVTEGAPELGCTLYADLLNAAFSEIDWQEVAANFLETSGEPCDGPAMPEMNQDPRPEEREPQEPRREENPFGELIFAYTREQAISDGVLVDVSEVAKEAGFKMPVALTRAVFENYVRVPEGVHAQDEAGRLWDILHMTAFAARRCDPDASEIPVLLHVRNSNRPGTPPLVRLKAHCGPGDRGEPVVTIMTPDED